MYNSGFLIAQCLNGSICSSGSKCNTSWIARIFSKECSFPAFGLLLLLLLLLLEASASELVTLVLSRLGGWYDDDDDDDDDDHFEDILELLHSVLVISRSVEEVIDSQQPEQGHRKKILAGTISWKHLTHAVCEQGFNKKYIGYTIPAVQISHVTSIARLFFFPSYY